MNNRELAGDAKHRVLLERPRRRGAPVPDGMYRMRVLRRDEGRVIDSQKEIKVDTPAAAGRARLRAPERDRARGARPAPEVRLRYSGPPTRRRCSACSAPATARRALVLRFRGGGDAAVWDGRLREGGSAPEGDYAFTVQVRDRAGNPTEAPAPDAERPQSPGRERACRSGRSRSPGRSSVVPAGAVARLRVGPFDRSFGFVLSRLGTPRPVTRGERIGGSSGSGSRAGRAPASTWCACGPGAAAPSGRWPWRACRRRGVGGPTAAARGAPGAHRGRGCNRVDDDHDGFADTLPAARRLRLEREFAGGGAAAGLRSESAPLLRFLDRAGLDYDLTTDLSLRAGRGRPSATLPAWRSRAARCGCRRRSGRLRRYVEGGGRVASFGADAFRRDVGLGRDVVRAGGAAAPANVFGERTALLRTGAAPLSVFQDELGLFDGLSSLIGEFTLFERSVGLPTGAALLVSAGREADQPAFVAFRLGDGLVLRTGTPAVDARARRGAAERRGAARDAADLDLLSGRGDLG